MAQNVANPITSSSWRVVVWGENVHDQRDDAVKRVYPLTMHETIAVALRTLLPSTVHVETATLQEPDHGLTTTRLDDTEVLVWWGHVAHDDVADEVVDRIHQRVLDGMGLVVLHSGHLSKIFRRLMGTSCDLRWREDDDEEVLWRVGQGHPILRGLPEAMVLDVHEMYGEPFDVPDPDCLLLISNFSGREVFRSGMFWTRGQGRVVYLSPGHETHPVYHHPGIQRLLANAVAWSAYDSNATTDSTAATGRNLVPGKALKGSVRSPKGWFRGPRS